MVAERATSDRELRKAQDAERRRALLEKIEGRVRTACGRELEHEFLGRAEELDPEGGTAVFHRFLVDGTHTLRVRDKGQQGVLLYLERPCSGCGAPTAFTADRWRSDFCVYESEYVEWPDQLAKELAGFTRVKAMCAECSGAVTTCPECGHTRRSRG
jgi:hypothetical protein